MPEYGWANNHTFVDEGSFALITEKQIFVTLSSAAADSTYVAGLLAAAPDADLLKPDSWTKCSYSILSCRFVEGEYETGHNACKAFTVIIQDTGALQSPQNVFITLERSFPCTKVKRTDHIIGQPVFSY